MSLASGPQVPRAAVAFAFVRAPGCRVRPGWAPRAIAALGLAGVLAAAAATVHAAGPNDAEVRRMIESLRPATAPAQAPAPGATSGRTRNLVIEPAAASPSPPPGAGASPAAAAPAATTAAPAPAAQGGQGAPTSQGASASGHVGGLSLAIAFEPNSAQLRPESGDTLGALVAAMISPELRQRRFVIEGHTDASGTPAQNLRLSRERAEQVRLYLVTLGVDGDRLRAVGKGASEPVNARDPRSPENRRVRVLAQP